MVAAPAASALELPPWTWALHWLLQSARADEVADAPERLMQAYVDGDSAAFDELYRRFAPRILALMRRGIRDDAIASELTQQTFLQLHRARNDYRAGKDPYQWVVTIALNLRRDAIRKKIRRDDKSDAHWTVPSAQLADRVVERAERAAAVREAMLSLKSGQREVIELHWFQGISFPQIAEVLGISLSAAKVRAHRGYESLRGLLAEVPR